MSIEKQFFLNHSSIDVYFRQSKDDFVVTEIPLYEFAGVGEHMVLTMRKKDLSTWDAVQIISDRIGCKSRDIGYAGLKDKNAMTIQCISMPRTFEEKIKNFEHPQIKFLKIEYHNNKVRVGHLKGNRFFIRLKRVLERDHLKLQNVLDSIEKYGMPNYFGVQRFGIDGDNYLKGKELCDGTLKVANGKLAQMYLNAYQSISFNEWLSKRIELSKLIEAFEPKELVEKVGIDLSTLKALKAQKHPFKVLEGDVMEHYPYGKIFYAEDVESEALKFYLKDRVPTGLLAGKKAKLAVGLAKKFEEAFDKKTIVDGTRRYAWVFPSEIKSKYDDEKNHFEVEFVLP
ncbi:MAG: tRNA pseudouridine(13) synthase TruD, partial [Arcobacter sp.]|nr:tRNA pseudouridine(13) synthase TruD [Arcobacter sp.]